MKLKVVMLAISLGMLVVSFAIDDWRWGVVWAINVAFWLDRVAAESKP